MRDVLHSRPPKTISDSRAPAGTAAATRPLSAAPADGLEDLAIVDRARYEVRGELARGGRGRISLALDRRVDRTVAIKEPIDAAPHTAARFVREALVTARLQHPSIVPVYDVGRWLDGRPFYAMKLVDGRSLRAAIDAASSPEARLSLLPHVVAVAEATAYAHSRGVIHRDLTPMNVLLGPFGETVVVDWGLAKDLTAPSDEAPVSIYDVASRDLTREGAIVGTPAYMAPEQARGGEVDERADVYALGAMLYHVLSGRPPFDGAHGDDVIERVTLGPSPRLDRADAPPDLSAIVHKAMARAPAERYPSAAELAEDLQRFATGQLVRAHAYSRAARAARWLRRRRALVGLAAASAVVVAVVLAGSVTRVFRERDAANLERAAAQARADALTLLQAQSALLRDPAEAIAWLKTYPDSGAEWARARRLALDAESRGVARHVWRYGESVAAIALSPDGRQLAAGGADLAVRVWDTTSGARLASIPVPAWVTGAAFSPDGGTLAVIDFVGSLHLRDARERPSPARDLSLSVGRGPLFNLAFSPDSARVAVGGQDGVVRLVDVARGAAIAEAEPLGRITSIAFTPDGRTIVAGGVDGAALVWEPSTGRARRFTAHAGAVDDLAVSPDGAWIASVGDDRALRLFRLEDVAASGAASPPTPTRVIELPDVALDVTFSPDAEQMATAGRGGVVSLVRVDDGSVRELAGPRDGALEVAFSPDGERLACAGLEGALSVWDLASGRSNMLRGHARGPVHAAWSLDGAFLASGGADGTARLWPAPIDDGRVIAALPAIAGRLAFAPKGGQLSIATDDGTLTIVEAGGERRALRGHGDAFSALAFTPDGALFTAAADRAVLRWELASGSSQRLAAGDDVTWALAAPASGAFVASAGRDGVVRIFAPPEAPPRLLAGHTGDVRALAASPDAAWLLSGGGDGTLRRWDVASGEGQVLSRGAAEVYLVSVSPEGRYAAAATLGGVSLWDTASWTARPLGQVTPAARVRWLAFSPDGAALAAATAGAPIHVWRTASGSARTLAGHDGGVSKVAFSPDGRTLASTGWDGALRVWDLATGDERIAHRFDGIAMDVAFSPDGAALSASAMDRTAWLGDAAGEALGASVASVRARLDALTTASIGEGGVAATVRP